MEMYRNEAILMDQNPEIRKPLLIPETTLESLHSTPHDILNNAKYLK